jgi:hypothetical protein
MIVKKAWKKYVRGKGMYFYEGYFLFGFLPLWIVRNGAY